MSSWPGVLVLLVALLLATSLRRLLRTPKLQAHNLALDGLRGYLAFGVFLHHSMVWYFYLQSGVWAKPPMPAYRELGFYCVGFFFMITAFLFGGKVLDSRQRPIDWVRLYSSRVLRIVPLFWAVAACVMVLVGIATHWELRESWSDLAVHVLSWFSAGLTVGQRVNGFVITGKLVALVTWSLTYEWLFYFSLPLIALLWRRKVGAAAVFAAICAVVAMSFNELNPLILLNFVVGVAAAAAVRREGIAARLRTPGAAVIALVAIAALLSGRFPHFVAPVFTAIAFLVIASGNTLFGLMSNRAAVDMGEISYGVYLLHGLVLATLILFVLGADNVKAWSAGSYWGLVGIAALAVVTIASLSYRFLEMPALKLTQRMTDSLHAVGGRVMRLGALRRG